MACGAGLGGLELASPRNAAQRGGSVMVKLPDPDAAQALLSRLRTISVFADARGAILRCSPGFMTTEAGIARLVSALTGK
jgi:kynureninase